MAPKATWTVSPSFPPGPLHRADDSSLKAPSMLSRLFAAPAADHVVPARTNVKTPLQYLSFAYQPYLLAGLCYFGFTTGHPFAAAFALLLLAAPQLMVALAILRPDALDALRGQRVRR